MTFTRRPLTASLTVVLALAATPAWAAPPSAGAQAEVLFREAKGLMAAGKIAEACAAFDASQKLDPTVSTLLNAANCREKNHQLATAWGLFLEAARQTRDASDEPTRKLHKVSVEHARRVEQRVSNLTIKVPPEVRARHPVIMCAGETIDEAMWNRALPLDGGTYAVSVRLPQGSPWSVTVVLAAEGDMKTIEVPVPAPNGAAPVADASRAPGASLAPGGSPAPQQSVAAVGASPQISPPSAVSHTPSDGRSPPPIAPQVAPSAQDPVLLASAPPATVVERPASSPTHRLPLVVVGGAVAALGGSLAFELWGDSIYGKAKTETDPARQDELWHEANTRRYVAEGLLVAGVGCAGAAAWLYFRPSPAASSHSDERVALWPVLDGNRVGFGMRRQF